MGAKERDRRSEHAGPQAPAGCGGTEASRGVVSARARKTRNKIAFFGHFDSSNSATRVLFKAILYHLGCFHPDGEITSICAGPETTAATHQIEAIPLA